MTIRFEEIDHTADTGIRAYGSDLTELFINAAQGMMYLVLPEVPDTEQEIVEELYVTADSVEDLLRDWLAELLYVHNLKGLFPVKYHIHQCSVGVFHASVLCLPMTKQMCLSATELKAVTWHGLRIGTNENGFEADIIFDV